MRSQKRIKYNRSKTSKRSRQSITSKRSRRSRKRRQLRGGANQNDAQQFIQALKSKDKTNILELIKTDHLNDAVETTEDSPDPAVPPQAINTEAHYFTTYNDKFTNSSTGKLGPDLGSTASGNINEKKVLQSKEDNKKIYVDIVIEIIEIYYLEN